MDRYRVTSTFNGVPPQKLNFLPNARSQISLPTKPHRQDPHIFPYLRPESDELIGDRVGRTNDDTEISIFDAERYFNESQDSTLKSKIAYETLNPETQKGNLSPKPRDSSSLNGFSRNFRSCSLLTTPTASSEASWNSQVGLLRKSQASLSISVASFPDGEQRRETSSSTRRLFGHSCPCSCKKSVDVEETYSEPKSSNPSSCVTNNSSVAKVETRVKAEQVLKTTGGFEQMAKMKVFPGILPQDPEIFRPPGRYFSLENPFPSQEIGRRIIDSGGFSFPAPAPRKENSAEDPARVSLEVFRPTETTTPLRNSATFQKGPFLLNAGDHRNFTFRGSPMTRPAVEDDVASDTSSDLFEIESFSTQMGFRRRDSLDEISSSLFEQRKQAERAAGITRPSRGVDDEDAATPSIAPSECYPPSEVSVEWSVTTAEGFDRVSVANFSSAVSEYEQLRHAAVALGSGRKKGIGGGGGGGLLGCRSEKAICIVGPKSEWFEPEVQRRVGNSVTSVGLDRILGVAQLGGGKPVHDSSGLINLRSRSRFI